MTSNKFFGILIAACFMVCALGLKTFDIDGVKYVFSESVRKNWFQANRYCRQKGMYLLDLESQEEHTKIQKYLENRNEIPVTALWLAGTSLGYDDGEPFYWFQSGVDVNITGFFPGQPDMRGDEYCLEISRIFDLQWNDRPCDFVLHFICRATKYFKLIERISDDPLNLS